MEFVDRPEYTLEGATMRIDFKSSTEFKNYTRRAMPIRATRLVAFTVGTVTDTKITCVALFNQTEPLIVDESIIDMVLSC